MEFNRTARGKIWLPDVSPYTQAIYFPVMWDLQAQNSPKSHKLAGREGVNINPHDHQRLFICLAHEPKGIKYFL